MTYQHRWTWLTALAFALCAGCQADLDEGAYDFACEDNGDCSGLYECLPSDEYETDICQLPGDVDLDAGDAEDTGDTTDTSDTTDTADPDTSDTSDADDTTDSGDTSDTADGGDACTETNGGTEICDGLDNDCDEVVDEDLGFRAKKLAAGDGHVCAVNAANEVFCWGANDTGEAAPESGSSLDVVRRPRKISEINATAEIRALALGEAHSCAVEGESKLYCWGDNARSQLGPSAGTTGSINSWAVSYEVARLEAGDQYNCVQSLNQNRIYCWGNGALNRMGASQSPSEFSDPKQVMAVQSGHSAFLALGSNHGCLLDISGFQDSAPTEIRCWGSNIDGKAGVDGDTIIEPTTLTSDFTDANSGPRGLQAISLGGTFSCGVNLTKLMCWGSNVQGELAQPSTLDATHEPQRITLPSGNFVGTHGESSYGSLATGKRHTCAIDTDSNMYCWGDGSAGQIGHGVAEDAFEPTAPTGDREWAFAAAGNGFTCAIESFSETEGEGRVYCWGKNDMHQLGLADSSDSPDAQNTPQPVACALQDSGP